VQTILIDVKEKPHVQEISVDGSKTPITPTRNRFVKHPEVIELSLSPASKAIVEAVKETLTPPQDTSTKKALENLKSSVKMKKKAGEIVTEMDAIAAMKAKEDAARARIELKEKKAELRKLKKEEVARKKKQKLSLKKNKSSKIKKSVPKKKKFGARDTRSKKLETIDDSDAEICQETESSVDNMILRMSTNEKGDFSNDDDVDDEWEPLITREKRQALCKKIYSSSESEGEHEDHGCNELELGDFVLAKYVVGSGKRKTSLKLFVGQVKEIEPSLTVDFMKYKETKEEHVIFEWPDNNDVSLVDAEQIIKKLAGTNNPPKVDMSCRKPTTLFSHLLFRIDGFQDVIQNLKKSAGS
jgi:hypothetical protein